jgi:hypothetical protein
MITFKVFRVGVMVILVVGAIGACSKEQQQEIVDDAAEVAARNVAAEAGREEFENAGIDVLGDLNCVATSEGGAQDLTVRCTGTATNDRQLLLEGTVSTNQGDIGDAVRGSFVGTVDGKEVFSERCFGNGC